VIHRHPHHHHTSFTTTITILGTLPAVAGHVWVEAVESFLRANTNTGRGRRREGYYSGGQTIKRESWYWYLELRQERKRRKRRGEKRAAASSSSGGHK
jgi:hypothetical protein